MDYRKTQEIGRDLQSLLKGRVYVDRFNRIAFSTDASIYQIIPQCVAVPAGVDDIINIVKYAGANNIPIAPRGAGSGLAGESLTSGIVIDITRLMNRIISLEDEGRVVVCEPGVVLEKLNAYLKGYGRAIGPDPSSGDRAVIGGVVANNGTGAHSLKYGYIAQYVEWIEAVMADGWAVRFVNEFRPADGAQSEPEGVAGKCIELLGGKEELIRNSQPATKRNRSGYNISGICHGGSIDFARLMAGSEGTLAVFTKIALRTVELPRSKGLVQYEFDSFEKMSAAVPIIVSTGAAACELMDDRLLKLAAGALPQYRDILPVGCRAVLLVEHFGVDAAEVSGKMDTTEGAIAGLYSGSRRFFDTAQQQRLWKSRKDAVPLLRRDRTAAVPIAFIEDVSVANGRLGEYINAMERMGRKYNIPMAFYGHAGDGELHIRPYLDLSSAEDINRMRAIAREVFELAFSLGGTISGEHADGLVRASFIKAQYGEQYYGLLCGVKGIFDPQGILNPGKIINDDPDVMVKNLRAANKPQEKRLGGSVIFSDEQARIMVNQCDGCGVCLATSPSARMCPVFRAAGEELGSSRGKNNLIRAWMAGLIDDQAGLKRILSLCVNCRMCGLECPAGIDTSELVVDARARLVQKGGLGRTVRLLANNRYMSMAAGAFGPVANLVLRMPVFGWVLEKAAGLDRRRKMPRFEAGSFLVKGRKYLRENAPLENPSGRVIYFPDSYANYNDHDLAWAVVRVLRYNNIEVALPHQRPAPLPAFVYGDIKTARRDSLFNIKHLAGLVKDGWKVVCSEPSAALFLRKDLPVIVRGADTRVIADARLIADNTVELMDYLAGLGSKGGLKGVDVEGQRQGGYAYHLPCHLCVLGCGGAGVKLLSGLGGVEITELDAGCCGLAGTFGMQKKNYDLADSIGANLAAALKKSSAQCVLSECSACRMQIEHLCSKPTMHPVVLLAMLYGLD